MIKLVLPYPISANRYWYSMADPKLITTLFRAVQAATRGDVSLARAFMAERAEKGNRVPQGRAMTFRSKEADAYKEHVAWLARAAGIRQPLEGPIEVEYRLYPHLPKDWVKRAKADPVWWDLTVQCIDLDNARKIVNDALNGIAWTDDRMIMQDPGTRVIPDGESRIELSIKPYERAHPQDGLFAPGPVYVPVKRVEQVPARTRRITVAETPAIPRDKDPF